MTPESTAPFFSGAIPTITSIQRTNLIVLAIVVATLGWFVSPASAIGCALGGAVVMANLFILAMVVGRFALAAASGGSAGAKIGMAALPLKLLLLAGIVYLLFKRTHIDGLGFGAGVLTQMTAIIIETGRAAFRPQR